MIKLPKYKYFDNHTQTLSLQSKIKHHTFEQSIDGADRDRLIIDDGLSSLHRGLGSTVYSY